MPETVAPTATMRAVTLKCVLPVDLHRRFMFARPMHQTPDMTGQHRPQPCGADEIDAANLRRAREMIEAGTARGRIVPEGL